MNKLLFWWHKRKADKLLNSSVLRLEFMRMFSNVPMDKVKSWTEMFHDRHASRIRKLKKKYDIK